MTSFAQSMLDFVTSFGSTGVIVGFTVGVFVVEMIRRPSRWLPLFLIAVTIGQTLMSTQIKDLLDRVRPTANPIAHTLGPSFPSGHTTGAAACFAAFALVLGRGRSRNVQSLLAGAAVFIAIAVAASRVLLGVHWLSDVIGGLALGWGWFALCSIAFGGRLLRLGAPIEAADARQRGSSENVDVRATGSSASSLTVTASPSGRCRPARWPRRAPRRAAPRPRAGDGRPPWPGTSSPRAPRALAISTASMQARSTAPGVPIGARHHVDETEAARRPPTQAAGTRPRSRAPPRWRTGRRAGAAAR